MTVRNRADLSWKGYTSYCGREGVCGGVRGGEKSGYSVWQSSRAAFRGALLCWKKK